MSRENLGQGGNVVAEAEVDQATSAPITPRAPPSIAPSPLVVSAPPSQFHSPSLSRSPLLTSADHPAGATKTPNTSRPPQSTAPSPLIVSAPPSQFHSPSLSRSPFLTSADHPAGATKTPNRSRPASRFITPLGSPLRKALRLTKLDPHDAWLPITESRNGNAYYAAFHTLCSGIGIQALVLPVAFTVLGWAWGVICLTLAFIWQLYTLYLLVQLHENYETGIRYSRYMQLASATFGNKLSKLLATFPILYLSGGTCVALIVVGGSTCKMLYQTLCGCADQPLTTVEWYLVFTSGAVVLSQLPNLNSIAGVSLIGAITAVGYCTLMWVVSVSKGRLPNVSYAPVKANSDVARVFELLNALGIIAFAFRGHNLVLEIQATMPSSEKHPSRVPMWRGVKVAYVIVAMCLFPLAIAGYWAYGRVIPANGGMLAAIYAFHSRDVARSVLGLMSFFVIVNALSSFQIYGMPMFDDMESQYTQRFKKPCPWWLRVIIRAMFGYGVFFVAVAIPFLSSMAGLIGAISLPVTLAHPCFMWLKFKKPKKYGPIWWLNWTLGLSGMGLSAVLSAAGVYVIIDTGIKLSFFKPQ
ncbi:lysine histidine transporter-like 8 [Coffea arabica]|uniref:Lysine histidine transporter-like 8 n=1 Tax=Coffea arabica TaxID=13443 RepID=A0A6P6UBW3_COFAR|nr:lysine histidine transporter-like 8 [Coffea arabica]